MPITGIGRPGPPTRYKDAGVNIGDRMGTFIWNRLAASGGVEAHQSQTATIRAACANLRKTLCTVKVGIHRSQR